MRYGVIADVHGNLPALEAALGELRRVGVDRYVCAGDLVGYGAAPNECVETVAALDPVAVAGNHDLIATGRLSATNCIAVARTTLAWTQEVLRADTREYLEQLPLRTQVDGLVVAHGTVDDSEEYTTRPDQATRQLREVAQAVPHAHALILGHTHRAWAYRRGPLSTRRGAVRLVAGDPALLNPGAVGQSRELRVRARFLVVDLDACGAEFRDVAYDVAACRAALRDAGLPPRTYQLGPRAASLPLRAGRRAVRRIARTTGRGGAT